MYNYLIEKSMNKVIDIKRAQGFSDLEILSGLEFRGWSELNGIVINIFINEEKLTKMNAGGLFHAHIEYAKNFVIQRLGR